MRDPIEDMKWKEARKLRWLNLGNIRLYDVFAFRHEEHGWCYHFNLEHIEQMKKVIQ